MPYARVLLSARSRGIAFIGSLESELPGIIAQEMSVGQEEPLTASDITIDGESVIQSGEIAIQRPRVLEGDVAIIIFGNNFPERVEKKDEIAGRIAERVKPMMPAGLKAYVWVLLCEGGFCSFTT